MDIMTVTLDDAMGMLASGVSIAIVAKAAMLTIDVIEREMMKRDPVPKKTTKKSTTKKSSSKKKKTTTIKSKLTPNVKTHKLDLSKFKVDVPAF
jgi:hypothetical protein